MSTPDKAYELTTAHDEYVCDLTRDQALKLAKQVHGGTDGDYVEYFVAATASDFYGIGAARVWKKGVRPNESSPS